MEARGWSIRILVTEDGRDALARAVLTASDDSTLTGRDAARPPSSDCPPSTINDELAVSRALEDLAVRLRRVAVEDPHLTGLNRCTPYGSGA
ncbi:DUF1876 family protein [Streptomyces sp. TRM66268-LWL]|uniref:DUF1876 family protein n=1 Tax=Streptomyces polyasparticus TaxID=2767826 RepID=A0ABR7SEE9_9ACTN|nr:dsRBD fold-containing protein [Streptomyces polyasparticus]MBC9713870.1 DUF1876 family protein [Streptomyces polyasparticus]